MSYHCKCFRCGEWFNSPLQDDLDGDGKCPTCALKSADIAKRVDEKIMMQRAATPQVPKFEDPRFVWLR